MKVTIVNCFDVYDRRVELLQGALQKEGHQVSVLIPNFRHLQKCVRTQCPEGFEMLPAMPYYGKFSPARIRSHVLFSRDALLRVRNLAPDLLWVLVPPNSLVKEAALYKRQRPELRLVLDVLDIWPESMPVPGFSGTPFGRFWRGLRDNYADAADIVVTERSQYWRVLQKHCDRKKLHTLFVPRDPGFRYLEGHPPQDRIALCFLGRVNGDVDYRAIGRLIRGLERPVELHVIGDGEEELRLRQTAEEAGAQVTFHGRLYGLREKQRIFDHCHFGLNLLKDGGGLTMKSADYLEASLPVINNVRGETWDFIERHSVGVNYDGETGITAAKLLALQSRREQIQALYYACFAEQVFSLSLQKIIGS